MRSEIVDVEEKKEFKPFSIKITAECPEDARLLYHLFNNRDLRGTIIEDKNYWGEHYNPNFTGNLERNSLVIFKYLKSRLEDQGILIFEEDE